MATHRSRAGIWTVILLGLVLGLGISLAQEAYACSRVLWNTAQSLDIPGQPTPKDLPVLVGRTMDWRADLNNKFRVFPRGIHREGLVDQNQLKWTSKYGSLVLTYLDMTVQEGMNEAGLTVATLFLKEAEYGDRDVSRPGLNQSIWPQYILDNFATVHDAIEDVSSENIQIIPIKLTKQPPGAFIPLHMAIGDVTGDSAIIEYVNGGELKIYHNPDYNPVPDVDYNVITNQPTYDNQIFNVKAYIRYDPAKPPYYFVNIGEIDPSTGKTITGLPGSLTPWDRFVRLYYYEHIMYKPQNQNEAASHMVGLLGNAFVPFNMNPDDWPTLWTSVMDLTHRVYYFNNMMRPNLVWVNMSKLDFSPHALQREYDVEHGRAMWIGDITNLLKLSIAKPFKFKEYSDYDQPLE